MAEVGAVYTVAPVVRTPEVAMARRSETAVAKEAPKAARKLVDGKRRRGRHGAVVDRAFVAGQQGFIEANARPGTGG